MCFLFDVLLSSLLYDLFIVPVILALQYIKNEISFSINPIFFDENKKKTKEEVQRQSVSLGLVNHYLTEAVNRTLLWPFFHPKQISYL